jgi:hypothetical protein
MDNHIVLESSLWDLHIHTCDCPKASGDFKGMSVSNYIDKLVKIFRKYSDLSLISFTDHNHISKRVYDEFESRKTGISVLPGIECDVFLDKETKDKDAKGFKHVIFYFKNDGKNPFDLDKDAEEINKYLLTEPAPALSDFLNFLLTNVKKQFLMSPHFKKQGERGIETNWPNAEDIKKNIDKYIDQLFCFWETSSVVQIAHALDYLRDYDEGNKVSLIHFSDSNSFEKEEDYLSNPAQYFFSLPTFDGVRMAGSDCRRISQEKITFSEEDKGKYLGLIKAGNCEIRLSPRLNCLIGGRGSGKSLFLDSISEQIKPDQTFTQENKSRKNYVDKLGYSAFDMKNHVIGEDGLSFDYFNQGYINNLFSENVDIASTPYFSDEFSSIAAFSESDARSSLVKDLGYEEMAKNPITDNLVSFVDTFKVFPGKKKGIALPSVEKKKTKLIPFVSFGEYIKALNRIMPEPIQNLQKIKDSENNLFRAISEEICALNEKMVIRSLFLANLKAKNDEYVSSKSEKLSKKKKSLELFRLLFKNATLDYRRRVLMVNRLSHLATITQLFEEHQNPCWGESEDQIIFTKEKRIQPIGEYLLAEIRDSVDGNSFASFYSMKKESPEARRNLIDYFCYRFPKFANSSYSTDSMIAEFSSLENLLIKTPSKIYYVRKGSAKKDLSFESPGTRANVLMEYLLFKKTSVPLLIDQPEDNIDNQTIFGKLTAWFSDVKPKRQVIVATHDANIVVNSDCENVIVCSQSQNDVFVYQYGALEYGDTIDQVAMILEGGKDAVERRMNKYGRDN